MANAVLDPPCAVPVNVDVACDDETTILLTFSGASKFPEVNAPWEVPPIEPPLTVLVIAPFVIVPDGV